MKEIPLTRGLMTLVDDEDYEPLNQRKWCAWWSKGSQSYYAEGFIDGKVVLMHQHLMRELPGKVVDHVDHDGLNNQRYNLRKCSNSQNTANSRLNVTNKSGYKGVTWDKYKQKWVSQIMVNYKHIHLGRFEKIEDAATAYDKAAIMYFSRYALTNAMLGLLEVL